MTTTTLPRTLLEQALEALELGYDTAKAEADRYHVAMAGFRPERHAQMDAEVQQIAAAITNLRAALAQQAEPVEHEALRLAGLSLIGLAEHDQHCEVFDLDDEGKHKACTCGLNDAIAVITQAGKSAPPQQTDPQVADHLARHGIPMPDQPLPDDHDGNPSF